MMKTTRWLYAILAAFSAALALAATTAGDVVAPIGFVACSNGRGAVLGYEAIGGTRMWTPPGASTTYHAGTVYNWAHEQSLWDDFAAMDAAMPGAQTIWWMLCMHDPTVPKWANESPDTDWPSVLYVLDRLRRWNPKVTIYVSAVNGYVAPHVCELIGPDGRTRAQGIADRLVAEKGLLRGPDMGELISSHPAPSVGATNRTNETLRDGCHPNGRRGGPKLGRLLGTVFGL
jgi:hypothetical protein